MKKYFFLAVAALALLACNPNGAVDPATKTSADQVSANAVSSLGKDRAVVVAEILKAGFVRAEDVTSQSVPMRNKVAKSIMASSYDSETFILNAPANFSELIKMDEEEGAIKLIEAVVATGKPCIIITLLFDANDKLAAAEFNLMAAKGIGAGNLFVSCSNDFFKSLTSDRDWEGSIAQYPENIMAEPTEDMYHEYTLAERSQYESKLVSAINGSGYIDEAARCSTEGEKPGYNYMLMWEAVPAAALQQEGIPPYVAGSGYIYGR
jgi:hypothetical protein